MAEKYLKTGDVIGKALADSIGSGASTAIQEVLEGLQVEIARFRQDSAPSVDRPEKTSGRREELQATLEQLDEQFKIASCEWLSLLQALEEVRQEISRDSSGERFLRTFAGVLGDAGVPAPSGGPAGSLPSPQDSPSAPPEAAPREVDNQRNLEEKLDELLSLVRGQLAARNQAAGRAEAPPEGWTHRIAREVASRLKENLPPASSSAAPAPPAPESRKARKISLDDVSSMVDELNRRNS